MAAEDQTTRIDEVRGKPGADHDPVTVGDRLRVERVRQGVGLRELARRVGVSPSLISQIEHGRANPSVGTLFSMTNVLDMSLDALFVAGAAGNAGGDAGPEPADIGTARADAESDAHAALLEPEGPVVRADQRHSIELGSGVQWDRLTPSTDPDVDFLHVVYPPGAQSCEPTAMMRHLGKEYAYVLEGRLGVTVGFDTYELSVGDSVSFDSTIPHRLFTVGDQPARAVFCVVGRRGDPRVQHPSTAGS
jgi:transcriptional regulator with XRE-family HTH domain